MLIFATSAAAWECVLNSDPNGPAEFYAVDKDSQELLFFYNKSPLKKMLDVPCSTGQSRGDKFREGDLKTPEGVYFVENRLRRDLNFTLYGNLAYSLNFPNPVDRLNGKTGHGIWIHGRGNGIASFGTKGCVAMNLGDLQDIGNDIEPGQTPVVIARDIAWQSGQSEDNTRISTQLASSCQKWAQAWSERSDSFFSFYAPGSYSKAQKTSFKHFKARKKRLFDQYPWIDVWIDKPRVVKGPNYWVTYFGQIYNAPGFNSAGIKRLYWMPDANGEFKVIGSEWRGSDGDRLKQAYFKQRGEELFYFVRKWKDAWKRADIADYKRFYAKDISQEGRDGLRAVVKHKKSIWESGSIPQKIEVSDFSFSLVAEGFKVRFVQDYQDSSGYADLGVKTLIVAPLKTGWKIVREDWRQIN